MAKQTTGLLADVLTLDPARLRAYADALASVAGALRRLADVATATATAPVLLKTTPKQRAYARDYNRRQRQQQKKIVKQQKREGTAALLAMYDLEEPRPAVKPFTRIATLISGRYLVKKADGYVRTGKEFSVQK